MFQPSTTRGGAPAAHAPGRVLAWLLAAAALLAAGAVAAQPQVVVTSKPAHSLVAAVMEGIASPRVLIDGTASAHTYAMKPSDAQALAAADVFIRVSEELEPFTGKLVASLPARVLVLTLQGAPGLQLLEARGGTSFAEQGARGTGNHSTHDPHFWLDPRNAKAMVRYIADALTRTSPAHSARLAANADDVIRRIDALDHEIEGMLSAFSGRPILVFHDAYQYLERRYGLHVLGSVTVGPHVHAGARRLSELRASVAKSGAACVFLEPQFEPKVAAAVVEGLPVKFGTLDPEASLLPPGPQLYFTLMRGLADSLQRCLS